MTFNLDRDLVFFDLEATGLQVMRDRIIQIGMIKYYKDGRPPEEMDQLINPGFVPIQPDAMKVHGITPQDLKNKPTFDQVAQKIFDFIGDADLSGYNAARFDIPMLMEEFARVGINWEIDQRRIIDVQRIFYKMEPRTLEAAHRFYCGSEMQNAHDALADVRATINVFKGQLEMYKEQDFKDKEGEIIEAPIRNDMQALHNFTNDLNYIDVTQKLKRDSEGNVVFAFGKHMNKKAVDVLKEEPNYFDWILNKEFSVQVKNALRKIKEGKGQ
jgi:DNA polymerase-3 subunit epsilon